MNRISGLIYGFISYAIFFATFLYAIGFVGNIFVPKGIDSIPNVPMTQALLINLGLLGIFAIQHSVMARPFFKRWITNWIPQTMERSTYTLVSSIALIALFAFWEPMGGLVWNIESPVGIALMYAGFAFGWGLVLLCTFLINHFDLFGLRQAWLYLVGKEYTHLPFKVISLYKYIRHPIMTGAFIGIWFTPVMTFGHLLFALGMSAYIFIGVYHEEKDLIGAFGSRYLNYIKSTEKFLPAFSKNRKGDTDSVSAEA